MVDDLVRDDTLIPQRQYNYGGSGGGFGGGVVVVVVVVLNAF